MSKDFNFVPDRRRVDDSVFIILHAICFDLDPKPRLQNMSDKQLQQIQPIVFVMNSTQMMIVWLNDDCKTRKKLVRKNQGTLSPKIWTGSNNKLREHLANV